MTHVELVKRARDEIESGSRGHLICVALTFAAFLTREDDKARRLTDFIERYIHPWPTYPAWHLDRYGKTDLSAKQLRLNFIDEVLLPYAEQLDNERIKHAAASTQP